MRLAGLAALTSAVVFALPAASLAADPAITATCNGGACSTGWYTSDVTVAFNISGGTIVTGCVPVTISTDSTGTPLSAQPKCEVIPDNSTTSITLYVPIKRYATPPTVTTTSAQRAPDANGWYNHAVQITSTGTASVSGIASCTNVTYSGPDSGSAAVAGTCTSGAGLVSAPKAFTLQYDATAPGVSAAPARAADADGWYNHPVAVAFTGSDAGSGIDSCTPGSYSGPDNGSASVAGSCRDKAGNTGSGTFALRYDSTPPTITGGTPDRAPDANGWYNHHLLVTFAGTDAASGMAACDAPAYDKPNAAAATLTGQCRDNAGNVSAPASFAFKFDSTPPKVTDLAVSSLDRTVAMTWKLSTDVARIQIVRTGGGAKAAVTVYAGKRQTAFSDQKVHNGKRYSYVLTAFDAAGNAATLKGLATPSSPLLAPRGTARVRGGATLRWRSVPKASYYNVQLWLAGKKTLTLWPAVPSLHLTNLPVGKYTWYVWPGVGPRSQSRYGALLGKSTFVVTG